MDTARNEMANYQCVACGNIHRAHVDKVIDLGDDIYYATICPHCGDITKHLWTGKDDNDKYIWADITLDERYY